MVYCTIDGKVAIPSTSDKIKVTYENQYVKDSGSYTYDINFPMSVRQNCDIFNNVQRLEVKKSMAAFEECRLYVDNRLVMSGKGTVTNITNEKVRLQLVGGSSRIKYNSKFEKHYIDELDYPKVVLDRGIDTQTMVSFGLSATPEPKNGDIIFIDLSKSNYIGQEGVCVLSPVMDETNGVMANRISIIKGTLTTNGHTKSGTFKELVNPAVQPYLMYVLGKVIENEGYTLTRNELDKDPWNRLVIVSACKSGNIKDALPHWTVYKFFDEIRKFFNASFVFDEVSKTVAITSTNELLTNDTVSYDCEDEFSSEYDEDGLDNLATSNIQYNFDDSSNRDWRDYIAQSVFKNYGTKEYASVSDLVSAAEKMSDRERRTTIFKVNYTYYIWAELPVDGNPENENLVWRKTQCGYFNPIIRDMDSDDSQELNICPAAVFQRQMFTSEDMSKDNKLFIMAAIPEAWRKTWIILPSVTNEKETSIEDMEEDDDGNYYATVQDAMQGTLDDTSAETTDEGAMPVAFRANCVVNLAGQKAQECNSTYDGEDKDYRVSVLYTDYRMYPTYRTAAETASLSLEETPIVKGRTFGNLDGAASESSEGNRFSTSPIDKNNLITIKFLTDEIPDPAKIYVFRNKRYICSKVEMNVSEDGIDKEKTGYFYELL